MKKAFMGAVLAFVLGGCSISTIKEGMNDLKGQPLSAAIAKLGVPDEEATVAGVKTYTWRSSRFVDGTQYGCRIRVVMAGDVIGSYEGSGDIGGCASYAGRLRS